MLVVCVSAARRVNCFNHILVDNLASMGLESDVQCVQGFHGFAEHDGMLVDQLSKTLDRYNRPDTLHLNELGCRVLTGLSRMQFFSGYIRESTGEKDGLAKWRETVQFYHQRPITTAVGKVRKSSGMVMFFNKEKNSHCFNSISFGQNFFECFLNIIDNCA